MSEIETREINLADIENLALRVLPNMAVLLIMPALARTVTRAERDVCLAWVVSCLDILPHLPRAR